MSFEDIIEKLKVKFGEEVVRQQNPDSSPPTIQIDKDVVIDVLGFLHETEGLYFDSLSCLTGIDNGPEANTMEVVYNLYSIPYNHHLMVQVVLDRTEPKIDSVVEIWKTADWQERETYDMYGVQFSGHPDLRRILMPADWKGYPLRKDYEHETYYRGVKIEY